MYSKIKHFNLFRTISFLTLTLIALGSLCSMQSTGSAHFKNRAENQAQNHPQDVYLKGKQPEIHTHCTQPNRPNTVFAIGKRVPEIESVHPSDERSNKGSNQLLAGSKVFLKFKETNGEESVDSEDALEMLRSYMQDRTTCELVNTEDKAEFTLELQVIKKITPYRQGKLTVTHLQTKTKIFETKWITGTNNMYYGFSGSRHAIGKLVKKKLLKEFPQIKSN